MKNESDRQNAGAQTRPHGEEERDNDAHRPDGSTGTAHDSTAQKTARDHDQQKRWNCPRKGFEARQLGEPLFAKGSVYRQSLRNVSH